jgi:hypothetical protein
MLAMRVMVMQPVTPILTEAPLEGRIGCQLIQWIEAQGCNSANRKGYQAESHHS